MISRGGGEGDHHNGGARPGDSEAKFLESEPKTLTSDQLRCAREAALYVSRTKSLEEALDIFTKGFITERTLPGTMEKMCMVELEDEDDEWKDSTRDLANFNLPPALLREIKDVATTFF